jgi:endonuclease G
MRARFALFVSFVLVLGAPAWATCADEYYRGVAPHLAQGASLDVREFCYDDFAVGHSGVTHTPLWSAAHLTAGEVDAARTLDRHDVFHAEAQLPRGERAELVDYRRSGFDRGRMAASGDMPTPAAQAQSFAGEHRATSAVSQLRALGGDRGRNTQSGRA